MNSVPSPSPRLLSGLPQVENFGEPIEQIFGKNGWLFQSHRMGSEKELANKEGSETLLKIEMQATQTLQDLKMASLKKELSTNRTLGVVQQKSLPIKTSTAQRSFSPPKNTRRTPEFWTPEPKHFKDSTHLNRRSLCEQLSLYPSSLSVEPKR